MRIYYQDDLVTLYLGDCRKVLPTLPRFLADVVVTDPCYGETDLDWDVPLRTWPTRVLPYLKPSGSLWACGSLRSFLEDRAEWAKGWRFIQDVVWEKHNGSGFHKDRFKRVHELVAQWVPKDRLWRHVYKDPQHTLDAVKRRAHRRARPQHMKPIRDGVYESMDGGPRLQRSVLRVRSCHGYAVHPTQKPTALLRPFIEYSCPPGGLVLDPFAGVGSTLVAARETGRRAIGIEKREGYCKSAVQRLAQHPWAASCVAIDRMKGAAGDG